MALNVQRAARCEPLLPKGMRCCGACAEAGLADLPKCSQGRMYQLIDWGRFEPWQLLGISQAPATLRWAAAAEADSRGCSDAAEAWGEDGWEPAGAELQADEVAAIHGWGSPWVQLGNPAGVQAAWERQQLAQQAREAKAAAKAAAAAKRKVAQQAREAKAAAKAAAAAERQLAQLWGEAAKTAAKAAAAAEREERRQLAQQEREAKAAAKAAAVAERQLAQLWGEAAKAAAKAAAVAERKERRQARIAAQVAAEAAAAAERDRQRRERRQRESAERAAAAARAPTAAVQRMRQYLLGLA